jgi:CelD/BcsL family acetyltransferase involved in cellulose biosynthesis
MTIVEGTRMTAQDNAAMADRVLALVASPFLDIPQRLVATARMVRHHPQADRMTQGQRIKTAAMLLKDRPGPQHIDGWAS